MKIRLAVLGCAMWFLSGVAGQEPATELREGFKNPPAKFRPMYITHSRLLTKPEMFDRLVERRVGGAVVDGGVKPGSANVGGEPYNNPTYLNDPEMLGRLRDTVAKLHERGMRVWIYDELGYPSGSAGGRVLEGHPEYEVWAVGSRTFTPAADGNITVEVTHPAVEACYGVPQQNGQLVPAKARDLTARARKGAFVWKAPSANWVVCLFERYQPDSWRRHNIPRRNVNILDRDAIARFIHLTHDKYAETLGPQLKDVELFFTDEPQFGATEHWSTGLPDVPPAVQWWEGLPAAFQHKYGYDVRQALPALFHPAGPKTAKYRHDFYDVQSDLVAENYYGQLQDWCHKHGVLSSGHELLEESLLFHVMFSGSYLKNMARQDIPGVDLIGGKVVGYKTMAGWGRESVEDFSNKMASSVAHLMGKPGAFSESFALANHATLREVLGVTAWQFSGGITHMCTYSIQEHFSPEDYAAFSDFAGRLGFFSRRGKPVADVAVMVPERSVWAAYNPPDGGRFKRYLDRNPEALAIDNVFRLTSHELLSSQRDFEFFGEDLLASATVEKGALSLADERFPFLVLPEVRLLRKDTLQKIQAFVKAGGRLAIVGSLPSETAERGEDPQITRDFKALLASHPERVKHVGTTAELPELIGWMKTQVAPEVSWNGPRGIRILRRREAERDILLVSNPAKDAASGELTLPASGSVFLWNPETGGVESLGGQKTVNLSVPGESARVVTVERKN